MSRVLLVDDDTEFCELLVDYLTPEGFSVDTVHDGEAALQQAGTERYDVIVLDVMLPKLTGFEVLRDLRTRSQTPVLMLTARGDDVDRIVGLEIGADDYVTKPFSPRELSARVKVILKRVTPSSPEVKEHTFVVDSSKAKILYHGQELDLTRYEFFILKKLLQQPERVFSREQIISEVWTEPHASMDRAVDTHIKTLRQKLKQVDDSNDPIKTHRGLGYSIFGSCSISGTVNES